jgi:hypothetical protein
MSSMLKPQLIKNPLTLIGLFAGLSEVAMSVVLIKLPSELQNTFMWFVIGYTILLTIAFFFILYKKPQVFYGPFDYKDDKSYLETLEREKLRVLKSYPIESSIQVIPIKSASLQIKGHDVIAISETSQTSPEYKDNRLYSFLNTNVHLSHNDIVKTINSAKNINELIDNAPINENAKSIMIRLIREFRPQVEHDFNELKNKFKGVT